MKRPLIGISGNVFAAAPRHSYQGKALCVADASMVDVIRRAGGVPVVLPVVPDPELIDAHAEMIDGLLLSGGADMAPSTYGAPVGQWPGQADRDRYELGLLTRVRERRRPIFGVCRGNQVINVAFGGTLIEDLPSRRPDGGQHRDNARYCQFMHAVRLANGSLLWEIFGGEHGHVNSVHHQGVDRLGDGLVAIAWSSDGLVEAVTAPDDRWTLGVQWHPEWDPAAEAFALFEAFCRESAQ